jgi:hypothetical protein
MDLEGFIERYGAEPGKDDLTILAPKQDDPTEQVPHLFPVTNRVSGPADNASALYAPAAIAALGQPLAALQPQCASCSGTGNLHPSFAH